MCLASSSDIVSFLEDERNSLVRDHLRPEMKRLAALGEYNSPALRQIYKAIALKEYAIDYFSE